MWMVKKSVNNSKSTVTAGHTFLPLHYEICVICAVGLHIIPICLQISNSCLSGKPKNKKGLWRNARKDAGAYEATTDSTQYFG